LSWLRCHYEQRAEPEPAFETVHLAPPVISTLPDPMMSTEAVVLA
jgi:hypothetical protein